MKFKNNYPMLEAANPDPSTPKVARKLYRIRKSNCPFKLGTACILYPLLISPERLDVRLSSEKHGRYTVFISSKRLTVPLLGAACKLCRNYVIIKTVCPFKIGAARKLYRLHLIRKSDCPFKLRAARKSYHTQLTRKSDYPSIPLCSVVKNDCLFTAQLYSTIF